MKTVQMKGSTRFGVIVLAVLVGSGIALAPFSQAAPAGAAHAVAHSSIRPPR